MNYEVNTSTKVFVPEQLSNDFAGLKHSDHSLKSHYLDVGDFTVSDVWNTVISEFDKPLVEGCNSKNNFRVYKCPNDGYKKVRPFESCHNHFCLKCAGREGTRLGVAAFKRLTVVPKINYGYYVFTVPSSLWHRFYDREIVDRWRLVCRDVLNSFYGCMIGGVERPHVWGDKQISNLMREEPHLNYIVPLVGFTKINKKPISLPIYHSRDDLARLRHLYLVRMNRVFNLNLKEVDIFYKYIPSDRPEKLIHVCNYVMRPPLELPLRKEVKTLGLYSKNRLEDILSQVLCHFEFYANHRSVRWFGWMSHHVFKDYLRLLDYSDDEIDGLLLSLKPNSSLCPICSSELYLAAVYINNVLTSVYEPPDVGKIESDAEVFRALYMSNCEVARLRNLQYESDLKKRLHGRDSE